MALILTIWDGFMVYIRLYPILLDIGGCPIQILVRGPSV